MKSSRSVSARNVRRNARRYDGSESDSDRDDSYDVHVDSARAERVFRHRNRKAGSVQPVSDLSANTNESFSTGAEKTLFRLSDSSDSEMASTKMNKEKSISKINDQNSLNLTDKNSTDDINNSDTSSDYSFKPTRNDLLKYRNKLLSSDDENNPSSSINSKMLNASNMSEHSSATETDQSGENGVLEEFVDKDDQSLENCSARKSFITPQKFKNEQKFNLLSSDGSDNELDTVKDVVNETNLIEESDSDNDIINSSNELYQTTPVVKLKHDKSLIETELKNLSLVEPSDSDGDVSAHYKSTIASSYQNKPFVDDDDIKFSNIAHGPICQSSILENSDFSLPSENESKNQTVKNIEVITLDDDTPRTSKILPKPIPVTIDLTVDQFDNKTATLLNSHPIYDSKQFSINDFESLKMEKMKLEEIAKRFKTNIDKMKKTMQITNLGLLPDGGLKLKQAIKREEDTLKDTVKQLQNVAEKLKQFPDSFWNHTNEHNKMFPPPAFIPPKSNIGDALTKKAAANIDVGAMGNKALSTYRTQQTLTLDILHRLHKSLETCPTSNVFAEDPKGLKVELMPHQKHAIAWLLWRESEKPHGGVLADDMGLGKTLTMISLILKDSEKEKIEEENSTTDDDSLDDSRTNNIKGGTLIICPSSLISQWINEVKTKLHSRTLDIVQHYGPKRETSPRRLARKNIVITTYTVVMFDQKKCPHTSPLFQIKWKRIILDEAHTIRNYKSQTSLAVCALSGINRWALSGTPIHNKETDFFALLKFIKCRPFDDLAVWKRWVGNNDEAGKNRLSLLVKTLMLRRTKAELSELTTFKLPVKTFQTVNIELFKEEKEAYEKVLQFSSSLFATYLYEKAEKENAVGHHFPVHNKAKYLHQQNLNDDIFKDHPELNKLFIQLKHNKDIQAHHILVLLLRLRQLCCHPCLMKNMLDDENLKVDGIQRTDNLDLVDTMSRMSIGAPLVEKQALTESNPIFKDTWVSSKIKAVCGMVNDKVLNTDEKAIIVSQWPSMLLLIQKELSKYNVETKMFSGSVPIPLRNKIVEEFNQSKKGTKILLLSLTAGGVGLNLIAANHLFLVDIHWNPQLEAQASDRIYRVGQTKPVFIYKFVCTNTIETTIQKIQSQKLEIASNIFGGCNNVESTKITLNDLKQIFNINPNQQK